MDHDDGTVAAPSRRLERLEDEVATLKRTLRSNGDGDDGDGGDGEDDLRKRFEAVAGELQALLAETTGGHGAIDTRSGGTITPLSPDQEAITIDDVAHALSNLTRFTGQGKGIYSVARHSVHVSYEVEARGGSPPAVRWGLLHDAPEAYLADVPAPVKRSLPGYTHAEARLAETVREAFDIDLSSADERLVDAADRDVGRAELARHFPEGDHERPALEFDPADFGPDALADGGGGGDGDRALFLERARELGYR